MIGRDGCLEISLDAQHLQELSSREVIQSFKSVQGSHNGIFSFSPEFVESVLFTRPLEIKSMEVRQMRRLFALTLALVSVSTCAAILAQDTKKPQEPEYANSPLFLDKDGTLKPLERQTTQLETKIRGLGYGGADGKYVVPNEHSTVRFPVTANLQFVVRPEPKDIDPATVIQLYSLKVSKGRRELLGVKLRAFSGSQTTLNKAAVPFDVAKYGEASVVIKPQNPLAPGEYMWTVGGASAVAQGYCFGVDPSTP